MVGSVCCSLLQKVIEEELSPLRMETAVSFQDGDSSAQNMHEFFHNPPCPLAERRGRAYLPARPVSCPQDTWYPICYHENGLDKGI